MPRTVLVTIAVMASLFIAGCGSKDTEAESTTSAATSSATASAAAEADTDAGAEGEGEAPGQTVKEYLDESGITRTDISPDTPGVPQPTVPLPADWTDVGGNKQEGVWGAIALTATKDSPDPTMILVTYSKFNGPVDPAKVLELAPNKLIASPDWAGPDAGSTGDISGFQAVTIAGPTADAGKPVFAVLTTVMIPRQDGVYDLTFMAKGPADQEVALVDAMSVLNSDTTIPAA